MKTLLSMALFLIISTGAFAGIGWSVTIKNQTANNVTISPAGHDWWWPNDFGVPQTMRAHETRRFYTKENMLILSGIVGINIDYGNVSGRVEMWTGYRDFSVTKNINSDRGKYIGTSSDFITTDIEYKPIDTDGIVYATIYLYESCAVGAADVEGDGLADAATVSNGTWHVHLSSTNFAHHSSHNLSVYAGNPLLGDMDGDNKADAVVVDNDGTWHVWGSSQGYQERPMYFGASGTALLADFDGDGKDDPTHYDPTDGSWNISCSGSGYVQVSFTLGGTGYTAVPKDYDGDGKADPAVYDTSSGTWAVAGSASGYALSTGSLGGPGYVAAPADFDGDGKADPAVYSAALGKWGVLHSKSNYQLGLVDQGGPGCMPVPGNYYSIDHANYVLYHPAINTWLMTDN